jgi:hypothetical protein
MRWIGAASDVVRRLLRPPRVVAVARRPAGWFAVGRRRLHDVVALAQLEDGQVVGLVASRRGLRPTVGRGWHGYLPPQAFSGRDVQLSPPAIVIPVVDLVAAIGDPARTSTIEEHAAIYGRLKIAAEDEWATEALRSFVADPERFLRRHIELLAEHFDPAELDASQRDFLAGLVTGNPDVRARAEAGREEKKRP